MSRPTNITSAYQPDGHKTVYRHIAADSFRPGAWVRDENWRAVLHDARCPLLADGRVCDCGCVDIKMLRRRRTA